MATDVFNNSSNNYVYPALSPCAGAGDDSYLQFLPNKSIGVIQGSNTLASISFSDIKIPVSSYSSQMKVVEPGEVTFIPGLTKGLDFRSQSFTIPAFTDNDLNPYFMTVDLSIGFYKNFKYYQFNVEASADYSNNITIDQALDIALSNIQAKITTIYDPSDLSFTGTQAGWDFNISNVELTLIDASENASSPFPAIIIGGINVPQIFELEEDLSKMVLYAKYPNSAMQGIILKATYPATELSYNKWIYINHVTDIVTIFEPIQIDSSTYYTPVVKTIEVGMSGCSNTTQMSAGDYLEWITENEDWKKVGDAYIWTSAPDNGDTRNLIDGFYVYNPQTFSVQIDYLIFV